jgi:hypothetical protein
MKSTEQFQAFYQNSLSTAVTELETTRKGLVQKIYIAAAISAGLILLSSVFGEGTVTKGESGATSYSGGVSNVLMYVLGAGHWDISLGLDPSKKISKGDQSYCEVY